MSASAKLKHELVALTVAWFYFVAWFGFLVALKKLTLEQYEIAFAGLSVALVGALVLAKVVLILEHVPLGRAIESRAAWVNVLVRTILYVAGVVVVLVLEKGIEGRHEHGGFAGAVRYSASHATANHIWVDTLCVSAALLGYNILSVVRRYLAPGGIAGLLAAPMPPEPRA